MNLPTNPMAELTNQLYKMNETLGKARNEYLMKEAERKHFEAKLVMEASGDSMAECRALAESSIKWLEFHQALARLESIYRFQELKLSIMEKEWQAQYLCHKLDGSLIRKEP